MLCLIFQKQKLGHIRRKRVAILLLEFIILMLGKDNLI